MLYYMWLLWLFTYTPYICDFVLGLFAFASASCVCAAFGVLCFVLFLLSHPVYPSVSEYFEDMTSPTITVLL